MMMMMMMMMIIIIIINVKTGLTLCSSKTEVLLSRLQLSLLTSLHPHRLIKSWPVSRSACSCEWHRPMVIIIIIIIIITIIILKGGARGGAVGWGTALKAGMSRVRFRWCHPSGRTVALGSTQHLTEMSTRNIFWAGTRVKTARA